MQFKQLVSKVAQERRTAHLIAPMGCRMLFVLLIRPRQKRPHGCLEAWSFLPLRDAHFALGKSRAKGCLNLAGRAGVALLGVLRWMCSPLKRK